MPFSNDPTKCPSVPVGALEVNRCDFFLLMQFSMLPHAVIIYAPLDALNNSAVIAPSAQALTIWPC